MTESATSVLPPVFIPPTRPQKTESIPSYTATHSACPGKYRSGQFPFCHKSVLIRLLLQRYMSVGNVWHLFGFVRKILVPGQGCHRPNHHILPPQCLPMPRHCLLWARDLLAKVHFRWDHTHKPRSQCRTNSAR